MWTYPLVQWFKLQPETANISDEPLILSPLLHSSPHSGSLPTGVTHHMCNNNSSYSMVKMPSLPIVIIYNVCYTATGMLQEWMHVRQAVRSKHSVSNRSGPLVWVQVQVQTEPLPNCHYRRYRHENCQFRYSSIEISLATEIGCYQQVGQQVQLKIHIMQLFLQQVNSILSKPLIQHPKITVCRYCSLRYRFVWKACFSCYMLYFWI